MTVAERSGGSLDRAWVVGGRADTDIAGAVAIGARSGWIRRGRLWEENSFEPTVVAESAFDAILLILAADGATSSPAGAIGGES